MVIGYLPIIQDRVNKYEQTSEFGLTFESGFFTVKWIVKHAMLFVKGKICNLNQFQSYGMNHLASPSEKQWNWPVVWIICLPGHGS